MSKVKNSSTNLAEIIEMAQKPRAASESAVQRAQDDDYYDEEEDVCPIPPAQAIPVPRKIGEYELRGTIGEGSFSIVKLAYSEEKQQYFACKVIQKQRLLKGNLEQRFEAEIRIHQQLHNPGIVQLYDILKDDDYYYVFMEFCAGGELFQYIVDRQKLSEETAKPFLKQLMESMVYLHKLNVCHRDLKPENLLLDQFGNVKISDFGLSRFLYEDGLSHTPCGSPCYASPECLSGKPYDGKKSDVWSCGVILYAMVTGQLPWTKRNQNQLFDQIRRGEYIIPAYLSANCTDLIYRMMCVNYKIRPTAEAVLQHPFLQGLPPTMLSVMPMDTPIISLRRVDNYFERCDSYYTTPLPRDESSPSQGYESILKSITGVGKVKARHRTQKAITRPSRPSIPAGTGLQTKSKKSLDQSGRLLQTHKK